MNTETIKEISEIVKNINIGFDGKLNSKTVEVIVAKVMPYLYIIQIKSLLISTIWAVAITLTGWFIGKAIINALKEQK